MTRIAYQSREDRPITLYWTGDFWTSIEADAKSYATAEEAVAEASTNAALSVPGVVVLHDGNILKRSV